MLLASSLLKNYLKSFSSQKECAEFLGISESTISNLANGNEVVSGTIIEKIKAKTGMDFEKAFEIK